MSLRDDLAKRLCAMKWSMAGSDGESVVDWEIDAAQGPPATWGDLADECIRQMEWAKQIGHDSATGKNHDVGEWGEGGLPLTLAPEDWKP